MPVQQREQEDDDDDDFTFPTPPQPQPQLPAGRRAFCLPCSASLSSSPIRRSFSAADSAASPWRARVVLSRHRLNGACSPALSDYAAGFCDDGEDEEEEERMDSLWEDLNDEDAAGDDQFLGSLDVSRRRSVGAPDAAERARRAAKDQREAAALGTSRSSRRRSPGLVVMMRALKRIFVAHKGKSKVHRDEQSTASASAASSSSCSNNPCKK
ncbi:uncharacterized protein LOC133895769 [Phragmites australis]|uniref:uncharacterized protein LOC133895769 n=1 Tax=Phragmites australis TaxID=29695 RepID=UPI002D79B540|nr:uncharacterized protein LOC133895769 [Phragmites australis]